MGDLYRDLIKAIKKHSDLEDDDLIQVAEHGADTGWSGFTYTKDTVEFYDENEDLIWELLEQQADEMGSKNIMEFIGGFTRANDVTNLDSFKNLLSWYALEEAGRHLLDQQESER